MISRYDPISGQQPSIPEPFWIRSWRTFWRWRPACYSCRLMLRDRYGYDQHYLSYHLGQRDVGWWPRDR